MEEEQLIKKAKQEFETYVGKDKEKMNLKDFEQFIKNFFADQPNVLKTLNIQVLFDEFSKEEEGKMDEREFRMAYKDLTISRMDTNDRIKFDLKK